MDKRADAGVVTIAKYDDVPTQSLGLLIPVREQRLSVRYTSDTDGLDEFDFSNPEQRLVLYQRTHLLVLSAAAFMFMLSLGITTYVSLAQPAAQSVASPIIVMAESGAQPAELQYGSRVSFSEPSFFADIKEALVLSRSSFIEADLEAMELRYFDNGEPVFTAEILSKGVKGSVSETPAGMYAIESKQESLSSAISGAYHPWSMSFQGNFYIHGQPYFTATSTELVAHEGGGVRLSDTDAEKLFDLVEEKTTVLVHEAKSAGDAFVYEPTVPEVTADHYLVADISNNAVLAGSDMDIVVPIASLTKLMTAMVAVEHLNVEDVISLENMSFPSTTIPRLAERSSISVYDSLRLMLLESSNEAANVVADQIGRTAFVELMNKKAASLGLLDTTFTDPSGLSAGNVSTLRDLLHFTQYLYNNRSFILKLTADTELLSVLSEGDLANLSNFNDVSGDDSFVAGKIGETNAAGQTSISLHSFEVKGVERIIAIVILQSENRPSDILQLTQYITERFKP